MEDFEFKKWFYIAERRFQFTFKNDCIYMSTRGGNHIGSLYFLPKSKSWDEAETAKIIHIDHIEIDSQYQGNGIGTLLLIEFKKFLQFHYPMVKYITADATSQGIIKLMTKIFGQPIIIKNMNLPERSPDDWKRTDIRQKIKFRV